MSATPPSAQLMTQFTAMACGGWVSQMIHVAAELGLADALGSVDYVAREIIKAESIVDYTQKENIAERFAKRLGAGVASGLQGYSVREGVTVR